MTPEDEEIDRLVGDFRSLTPEQRELLARRVIGRARAMRAQALRDLFRHLFNWIKRRRAAAELRRFDDRTLKDMGITRGEIDAVVRGWPRDRRPDSRGSDPVPSHRPAIGRAA
jgi:uncharacterized protein YjiS (DUF1127 family)